MEAGQIETAQLLEAMEEWQRQTARAERAAARITELTGKTPDEVMTGMRMLFAPAREGGAA